MCSDVFITAYAECVVQAGGSPVWLSREAGIRHTDKDVAALPLHRHDFHGEWNYTLSPPDTP